MTPSYPPPLYIDNEVTRMQTKLFRALFDLHMGRTIHETVWFWGKRYLIVIENGALTIRPVIREIQDSYK